MKRLIFVALIALAGCAASKGNWPSLAPRPIETAAADTARPAAPATPAPPSAAGDANARLATATRDLDTLAARWTAQVQATTTAVAAAKGLPTTSDQWSAAQLELSRLEQSGNQIADMRDQLDRIAGDLALAAQAGGDVSAAIVRTGTAIAKVEKLRADHKVAFASANAALPR